MSADAPPAPDEGATPANAPLRLDRVTVRFGGIVAIDDASLAVGPGEVVGLIGPNGAGKTTLFNVACGIVRPRTGTVRVMGVDRPRPHRLTGLGVARTLQGLGLFPGLTVRQNVMAGLSHGAPGAAAGLVGAPASARFLREAAERAEAALARVGLAGAGERMPEALPYPERKRVALARAFVSEPRLLLLDEPAGGLGAADIDELAALVRDFAGGEHGRSVLLVEHHVDLVMSLCDRIAVLDSGRMLATGTPDEIRDDQAVVDAYLGVDVDGEDAA